MFSNVFRNKCELAHDVQRQTNKYNQRYLLGLMKEDRDLAELKQEELRLAKKDPASIREQEMLDVCKALQDVKHEVEVEERTRQKLRNNTFELRVLQKQILAAKSQLELAEQKLGREKLRDAALDVEREAHVEARREQKLREEEQQREEEAARQKKLNYAYDLKAQMAVGEMRRERRKEKIREERRELNAMVQRMDEEDAAELAAIKQSKLDKNKECADFLRQRTEQKIASQMQQADDSLKREMIIRERERKQELFAQKKREERDRAAALTDIIRQQVQRIESEKRYRQDFLFDLLVEERAALADKRYEQKLQNDLLEHRALHRELEVHLEMRELHKEKILSKAFAEHKKMLELMEKYKQMDQEVAVEVLEKKKVIRRMIDNNVCQKRQHDAHLKAAKLRTKEQARLAEEKVQAEITAERLRLLEQVPPRVFLYMPDDVLRESEKKQLNIPPRSEKIKFAY